MNGWIPSKSAAPSVAPVLIIIVGGGIDAKTDRTDELADPKTGREEFLAGRPGKPVRPFRLFTDGPAARMVAFSHGRIRAG